ncbi:MAG: glycolate oxidase subunit GlcF [Gammaproteobacteria bacterium]|nr:glycolate oxidase subunit GlcF [Gammaproteobacteria bacterium]
MQTQLSEKFKHSVIGQEADDILRSCVHCGFCTATCPTYQLLGDELDSPRGRIYLIKEMLEGGEVTESTQLHLDRCLTCRACETTCPSGVRYGRLIDIGREIVDKNVPRSMGDNARRYFLRKLIEEPRRFKLAVSTGQFLKPFLPNAIKQKVPAKQTPIQRTSNTHSRRMLALSGCGQSVTTPNTNIAAANVLDKLGIQLIEPQPVLCCGSVSHHMSATKDAQSRMHKLIDQWWPYIEPEDNSPGVEAIVISASGCGATIKEYGDILKHDNNYAEKAQRVSELAKDLCEVIANEPLDQFANSSSTKIAFHSPCTLQHAQQLNGIVEKILEKIGYQLTVVADSHICCGSAGTYSIMQPELSQQLLNNKLDALEHDKPDIIVTANIGCQLHLATKSNAIVKHWIELLTGS